jgi:hypothetical protein
MLFGEQDKDSESVLSADKLADFTRELDQGLKALGALTLVAAIEWQSNTTVRGQLKHKNEGYSIVVWSSPEFSIKVRQKTARWRSDVLNTAPLIVFWKSLGGPIQSTAASDRRADIGRAPGPARRSAAEPVNKNIIIETNLDDVSQCLDHDNSADAVVALTKVLTVKGDMLKAQGAQV